jgi:transcriptional regulator with XRE-family HTH domain
MAMAKRAQVQLAHEKDGPDPIDVVVGLNLRRVRLARGVSQVGLADALGITFQQIQKYERAANRVSASMLVKAARFLGVPAADLLPPDEETNPALKSIGRPTEISGAVEALNAYCEISSPELRGAVLNLMRTLGPKSLKT